MQATRDLLEKHIRRTDDLDLLDPRLHHSFHTCCDLPFYASLEDVGCPRHMLQIQPQDSDLHDIAPCHVPSNDGLAFVDSSIDL